MSTYVCEGAIMRCCFGSAPARLVVSAARSVTLTNGRHANIADHNPFENIPSFGICHKDASHPKPCSPGTMCLWEGGNYDYLIRNYPALLDTSYCKCINGGIIRFVKDGQTKGEFDLSRNSAGQEMKLQEDDNPKFPSELVLDAIEFVPVIGSIVGIGRNAMKGDWAMVGLNAGFLVLDVFTVGAGSTLAKVGVKGGAKAVAKSATKEVGKQVAKRVEKGAAKESIRQISETTVKSQIPFLQLTLEEHTKQTATKGVIKVLEDDVIDLGSKKVITEVSETGANTIGKSISKLAENTSKQLLNGAKNVTKGIMDFSQLIGEHLGKYGKEIMAEVSSPINSKKMSKQIQVEKAAEAAIKTATQKAMKAAETTKAKHIFNA